MYARKKVSENDPLNRGVGLKPGNKKSTGVTQAPGGDRPVKGAAGIPKLKKAAVTGPAKSKRAAFGDLTNATKEKNELDGKEKVVPTLKPVVKGKSVACIPAKAKVVATKKKPEVSKGSQLTASQESLASNSSSVSSSQESLASEKSSQALRNLAAGVPVDRVEEDFSFLEESEIVLPDDLLSIDKENYTDVFNVGIYAQDIFDYYKSREEKFQLQPYLNNKRNAHGITPNMRAILVDWLVEIQENFELNHETLYLAVKLIDLYLSRNLVDKEKLQLVGAAATFIAAKFDERCPPLIEDFTYICDNAFDAEQFLKMEMEILRKVEFDLGIPISYRFLRRYARVARSSTETLTLARFILEYSLMEYSLIDERDSMLAAAALYIAMKMRQEGSWEGEVVQACGYELADIKHLIVLLNKMLLSPPIPQLNTIRSKYSHKVFHEVAKIPALPLEKLL